MKQIRTYKYKLYTSKKNRSLDDAVSLACEIWNHCIMLHRKYYRIYGKYLNKYKLQKHLTKLMRLPRYKHWHNLGSQAIQDITDRIDRSYKAFFSHVKEHRHGKKSVPHFCKESKYRSITFKQAGYKFLEGTNRIVIMGKTYKYAKSRKLPEGKIKTLTVKRNTLGEFFIYVCMEVETPEIIARAGNAAGMDFGLEDFLTLSDGTRIASPLWMKENLSAVRSAHRRVSRCVKGSNNRMRAVKDLDRLYSHMADSRTDWFMKLAGDLTAKYSAIRIEDLNLDGMKRLWGRKVSDLSYAEFVKILEYKASLNGCAVEKIPRTYPSSKICHKCGCLNEVINSESPDSGTFRKDSRRHWICPSCSAILDKDVNAACNVRDYIRIA